MTSHACTSHRPGSALDLDATVAAIVDALNASDSPVSVEPRAVLS